MRSYLQTAPGALGSRRTRVQRSFYGFPRFWLSNLIQTRAAVGASVGRWRPRFSHEEGNQHVHAAPITRQGRPSRPLDVVLRGVRAGHENYDGEALSRGNRDTYLRVRLRLQRNSRRAPSLTGGDDSPVEARLGPACKQRPCAPRAKDDLNRRYRRQRDRWRSRLQAEPIMWTMIFGITSAVATCLNTAAFTVAVS